MSLVEIVCAMGLLGTVALAASATLMTTAQTDVELKDRGLALRAALGRMEAVKSFDHAGNIQDLVDHLAQPENQVFSVPGLARRATSPAAAAGAGAEGRISCNAGDPDRIQVTVTVLWAARSGAPRQVVLRSTLTEIQP